jgi:hypothetical protein
MCDIWQSFQLFRQQTLRYPVTRLGKAKEIPRCRPRVNALQSSCTVNGVESQLFFSLVAAFFVKKAPSTPRPTLLAKSTITK